MAMFSRIILSPLIIIDSLIKTLLWIVSLKHYAKLHIKTGYKLLNLWDDRFEAWYRGDGKMPYLWKQDEKKIQIYDLQQRGERGLKEIIVEQVESSPTYYTHESIIKDEIKKKLISQMIADGIVKLTVNEFQTISDQLPRIQIQASCYAVKHLDHLDVESLKPKEQLDDQKVANKLKNTVSAG